MHACRSTLEDPTGFLALLAQPLLAGRTFEADDARSAEKPVLLAESAARHLFGRTDAIGQRLSFEDDDPYTVVGIVSDIRAKGLGDDEWRPLGYEPLTLVSAQMTILVRATQPDAQLLLALRQLVRTREPDAIANVATIQEQLGATLARERFTSALLAAFALLALLLAAVGLYGLVSQLVITRTHEIGVRIALGANARQIVRLIAARGITATCAGLVLGVPLLVVGDRMLRERLPAVTAEAGAYAVAGLVLFATAVAASALPAFAAARLEPRRAIDSD